MERTIITKTDIREFYPMVSVNIDSTSIDPVTLLAQQNDLETFLGPYLYAEFIEDFNGTTFATQKFIDLFKGKLYTHESKNRYYRGLRQLLALYATRRLIEHADFYLTDSGMVQKLTDESEPKSDAQMSRVMMKIQDDVVRLERDAELFMDANAADYPEFAKVYSTDKKTSFNFRKVWPVTNSLNYI